MNWIFNLIYNNANDVSILSNSPKKPYTILNVSDIRHRQNEQISYVISVLSLPKPEACLLLCHYKWNTSRLLDNWFVDEKSVRNKVGLFVNRTVKKLKLSKNNKNTCGICFEVYLSTNLLFSTSCGDHYYCKTCWESYIRTSIKESGSGCLSLRCPDTSCSAAVSQNMINVLARQKDMFKYSNYFMRSYVESNKGIINIIKWCPSPGCDRAVEFEHGYGIGGYGVEHVTCDCSHCYCWNCRDEPHRPVDCKVLAVWITLTQKNSEGARNTKWILAYTKPCPKCNRPIEKNLGCDHMTCRPPCGHQFCWLCLAGDWNTSHKCRGSNIDEQKQIYSARQYDVRLYRQYYERWERNHNSMQKAIQCLDKLHTTQLRILSHRLSKPMAQFDFILQAWRKIVKCRRVLKWSYAYGYIVLEHENEKRQLLTRLQYEAETELGKLQCHAEIDYLSMITADFENFQKKLTWLTTVTDGCFDSFVRRLENGLSEEAPLNGRSLLGVLSLTSFVTREIQGASMLYYFFILCLICTIIFLITF